LSRCCVCGKKLSEKIVNDQVVITEKFVEYYDEKRDKTLFVCLSCPMPTKSPSPVKLYEAKEVIK